MKKWLKSLFRANSLIEIEEEFEEKPVEEKVYQSHSIDKKRDAVTERPNFRFPIELDEESPKPKAIQEKKVEPVFQQEKNYAIWQKSTQESNRLNRDDNQSTYNKSSNFVNKSFKSDNDYSKLTSQQVKNHVPYKQDEQPKVEKEVKEEKEEKVDIVFRPKRKTPFRPSEYISPIYGYQKPKTNNESDTVDEVLNTEDVDTSQTINDLESSFKNDGINTSNMNEKVSFSDQTSSSYEVLNQVEKEEIQIETPQIEVMIEELQPDLHVEIKNEVKNDELEVQIESKNAKKDEEIHLETLQIEAEKELQDIELESENEVVNQDETLEQLHVEDVNEHVNEHSTEHKVATKIQYKNIESNENDEESFIEKSLHNPEMNVENKHQENIATTSSTEEEVQSESRKISIESNVDQNEKNEEKNQNEISSLETNDIVREDFESNQESKQTSTIQEETERKNVVLESKGNVKREKKRHFPFNVLMLRSDVEATRKANIMRQLRELQKESAATIEMVNEKVDSKEKENEQITEITSSIEHIDVVSNEQPTHQQNQEVVENVNHQKCNEETTLQSVLNTNTDDDKMNDSEKSLTNNVQQEVEEILKPPVLYELPQLDLLVEPPMEQFNDGDWVEEQKQLLQETLLNFNVGAKVIAATQGPTVTRFEVQPDPGVKVNKITNLQDDIKLSLAARDIRIEAPIPGRSAIGIEVPNKESKPVYLRELVNQDKFLQSESPLTVALGLDIGGEPVYADISKMPHGLIAGATGSGKSVCINSILVSILYKAKPHEVKLILIDPKMVELAPYNHIPHLISPVITDARAATAALKWACEEMDRRYDLFAHAGARDIKRFNDLAKKKGAFNDELPYLVIIIDELADLMMVSPGDVETYICRIAQKARACGIHLLVATQRPSVDVITGIIKSNIPTRIAFTVSSQVDSRTIIDIGGAEKLLGRGDMLFLDNGKSQAIRLQGVYVSDDEIEHVVEIVKDQQKPNYLFNQEELVAKADAQEVDDELFEEAVEFVIDQKGASVSMLQRRFRIGYNRAARLVDLMFDHGIVSNQNGSKPREVLITLEEFRSES